MVRYITLLLFIGLAFWSCGGSSQKSEIKVSEIQKRDFKNWAIENTGITDVVFQDNGYSIWVWLTPEKYTNKGNVKKIAEFIARAYKMQTGYNELVIVTVWDYNGGIYAKGNG